MAMFLYFRHHAGTTLSEPLGFIAGLLGLGLIWRGSWLGSEGTTLFGIGMSAFALNIRPGAMFVLPFLLFWAGYKFRGASKFSFRMFLIGAVAIVGAFILNLIEIRLLAGPDGEAFANFSWALFGLASGGNSWTYIFQAHPEISLLPENEQNNAIYKLAIDLMIQNPSLAFHGALKYWGYFFSNTWYNAYAFLAGNNYYVNEIARWGTYFFCILGILNWIQKPQNNFTLLAVLGALGILASVPFVPPTDAYRVRLYAATISYFALLPSMGVVFLRDKYINYHFVSNSGFHIFGTGTGIKQLSFLVIFIAIFAPIIKFSNTPFIPIESPCPSDLDVAVVEYHQGTYINITREGIAYTEWMPNFHISTFRRNIHGLVENHLVNYMESIRPSSTIFYAINLQANQGVFVVINSNELPSPGTVLALCGYWVKDPDIAKYNIFEADFAIKE